MPMPRAVAAAVLTLLSGCASAPPPAASAAAPCPQVDDGLRTKDATALLERLGARVRLSPEVEALRKPASLDDVREILKHDHAFLFRGAAAYANAQKSLDARVLEASLELFLGESQLLGSQVLTVQAAAVSADVRMARANAVEEGTEPTSERGRVLAQLVRTVEDGNAIADALGVLAPSHLKRGGELARAIAAEAPNDPRTYLLAAEYQRLRGAWPEFESALATAEKLDARAAPVRYLKAMEQLERYRKPEAGAALLREALAASPGFVRAQAALVLMAPTPGDALKEITKLRQMNRDHYLVLLLEPTLSAARELERERHGR
jgi:hypothetical protein